jgi:hypothetical protein
LELLGLYCRELVRANNIALQIDTMHGHLDDDAEVLERRLVKLCGSCTTMATKLRLTVQAGINVESGMIAEKGDNSEEDDLRGGHEVWGKLRAVK